MSNWAASIPVEECADLAALRLFPGLECARAGEEFWIRAGALTEDIERALARVPRVRRFEVLEGGRLRPAHSRIPSGELPSAQWRPLREVLAPVLPTAALPGETRQKLALTLVRGGVEQPPAALLTSLSAWGDFAKSAPLIRLEGLVFAVSEDHQALIVGVPVPPLPGVRMTNQTGVLAPCGFAWSPPVGPAVIRELLGLAQNDVAILAGDGTHQVVRAEQFMRASRSAARATTESIAAKPSA